MVIVGVVVSEMLISSAGIGYLISRYRTILESAHFFFQAEDGIRDKLVTGVQTCALPICRGGCRTPRRRAGVSRGRRAPGGSRPLARSRRPRREEARRPALFARRRSP